MKEYVRAGANGGVVLLAVAIPFSVALSSLVQAWVLICGLVVYAVSALQMARSHPVAQAASLLFAALVLGCVYSDATQHEQFAMLVKYLDLLFIPLFLVILRDEVWRERAELAFLGSMALTAAVSWGVGLFGLSAGVCVWSGCSADNPSIFMDHIAQNMMMAFAAYLLALRARMAIRSRARWMYVSMALLTGLNVIFMVPGRTGYLVLVVLISYFVWQTALQRLQQHGQTFTLWKKNAMLAVALLAGWSLLYQLSPRLHDRMVLVAEEASALKGEGNNTSIALRLEFYRNSLHLAEEHPLFGVGTAGFAEAYRQYVAGSTSIATINPHNEFLHLTVQLGLVGLSLFCFFLYSYWHMAHRYTLDHAREGGVALMLMLVLVGMLNTPLMDHSEGLFFALMSALRFSYTEVGAA